MGEVAQAVAKAGVFVVQKFVAMGEVAVLRKVVAMVEAVAMGEVDATGKVVVLRNVVLVLVCRSYHCLCPQCACSLC